MFHRIPFLLLLIGLAGALPVFAQSQSTVSGEGAVVVEVHGSASFQLGNQAPQPLRVGQLLPVGAVVVMTEQDSAAVLAYPDRQITIIGELSQLRIVGYRYDSKDPSKGLVSLNLISGSLRLVVGEIGQQNPGSVRVQIGTATLGVMPTENRNTDANVVVLGGPVAVTVQQGQVQVLLPSGAPQQVGAGQGMYVDQDGAVSRGTTGQIVQQLGATSQGLNIQKQFATLQGYEQKIVQTVVTLAAVTSGLKDPQATPAALAAAEKFAELEILKQLGSLPATAAITSPAQPSPDPVLPPSPVAASTGTPSTGAGGGGLPCSASCN